MLLSKKQAFLNACWSNQRFENSLESYPWKLNSLPHFLHKILLEIDFVEEMKSTWGNKEAVPQGTQKWARSQLKYDGYPVLWSPK